MLNNSGLEFSNFLVILNLFQDLVFIFPDITRNDFEQARNRTPYNNGREVN